MYPTEFKKQNCVYASDQPEYLPLPAFKHNDEWKCVSSCWKMTAWERIKVLFTGKVWVVMPTFGKPLTPVKLSIETPCWNE